MPDRVEFELVTPERLLFSEPVEMVVVPGTEGDFGVLAGHAPLISTIRPGMIEIYEGQNVTRRIFVVSGVAEVTVERCTVLADEAALPDTLDRAAIETDLRTLEGNLPSLREQVALKRNLESLGEMSAGLAHEFKNAMAALHGYAQFLQSIDHDERGKAAAAALLQEVRNLSEMITSFLNFARPQPLQLEDISLDELIQECVRELESLFEARRVALAIERSSEARWRGSGPIVTEGPVLTSTELDEKEADRIELSADARMLRQTLLNLMRNALEAIPDSQTDRRVTVSTSLENDQGNDWVAISIHDTGKGIPASDLQKIFIPFFTTKSQGHGVGLALAHRVITEHGGTLTASNAPDGGAVFSIRLPLDLRSFS